jgi:hypothetical protein
VDSIEWGKIGIGEERAPLIREDIIGIRALIIVVFYLLYYDISWGLI